MPAAPDRSAVAVVAYYFARFDNSAYQRLGYLTWREAYADVGAKLGVKGSYVKNRRDGFDPLFTWRRGWWQRPLSASEAHIHSLLADVDEAALYVLVSRLLADAESAEGRLLTGVLSIASPGPVQQQSSGNQRAITGAAAEELFIELHIKGKSGFVGELLDKRLAGEGYDFLLKNPDEPDQYIELKGTAGQNGGISFTSKEWDVAQAKGDRFWLVVMSSVHDKPTLQIINNPAACLRAQQSFHTVIQTSWRVTAADLNSNSDPIL
ncbi:DUF3883 domain-containing protein [Hymenobacter wooponensis]|uniref:DUF3883 domain-containing protein n=1 Tax=Hymenobacter wooponensis TaxID=1525360 RepID=A0A4Z0MQT1_9BACT|nr:DUF3883 domain-containing protein [Hymenobacter wooponensis]TGD81698.1 DUF3883 domain-containing protein [Hymenobacter wooponensis]